MSVTAEGSDTAWRIAQAAAVRKQYLKDVGANKAPETAPARIVVLGTIRYFAGNDCTHQEAFEATRTASRDWQEDERPSDEDISNAEHYFIGLMGKVSGASRSE